MSKGLRLRTRWALVTAALVAVTGLVAVIVLTVVTERLLETRSRGAFAPTSGISVPPGAPAPLSPVVPGDAGHRIASSVIHDVRWWGVGLVAALVVFAVAAAWFVTGRMLRPLRDILDTAHAVTAAGEGHRIASDGPHDELRDLADTIDSMLDRLDASSEAQRQFVADASHELRTPLATMAVELDVALDNPEADTAELREALAGMRGALDRSQRLVESLLTLARAGSLRHIAPYALDEACQRAIATTTAVNPDLTVHAELDAAPVQGDAVLIDRLCANLLENAARYRTPGTAITVRSGTDAHGSWLVVENEGRAFQPSELADWFDRFRRGDRARATSDGGVGLGLSIVRQVAAAHGARVTASPQPNGGVSIEVRFPADGTPAPPT